MVSFVFYINRRKIVDFYALTASYRMYFHSQTYLLEILEPDYVDVRVVPVIVPNIRKQIK